VVTPYTSSGSADFSYWIDQEAGMELIEGVDQKATGEDTAKDRKMILLVVGVLMLIASFLLFVSIYLA
jgi:hypothetical protein